MLALALLIGVLGAPAHSIQLDCPLAAEIAEAAVTKNIHLNGLFEDINGTVEKTLLAAEIIALESLRNQMMLWQIANCEEGP